MGEVDIKDADFNETDVQIGKQFDATAEPAPKKRDAFSSRTVFIFTTIGSAVGLGNVWRFPYLCYSFGGATFFLPYLISLFIIGVPLMCSDFMFGQVWQRSNIPCYNIMHRRLRGVAIGQVGVGVVIAHYYAVILGYTLIYAVHSFANPQAWQLTAQDQSDCLAITNIADCTTAPICAWVASECKAQIVLKANQFFTIATNIGDPYSPKSFSWQILVSLIIVWLMVFLFQGFGARVLGYLMYPTMILPTVMLIVLLGVGCSLEGASTGIIQYIGRWDSSALSGTPSIWSAAAGQCLFSLSLGSGVMQTYASFNKRDNPCGQDSLIVPIADLAFAFVAGFVVFSIAGYLSFEAGIPLKELPLAGPGLVFVTYAAGISQLGAPWAQILNVMFFLTLYLLGQSSITSLIAPQIELIKESKFGRNWKRIYIVAVSCLVYLCLGVFYCVDWGMVLFDGIDYYVNNLGVLICVYAICVAVGWVYNYERVVEQIGSEAYWMFAIVFHMSCIVLVFITLPMSYTAASITIPVGVILTFVITFGTSFLNISKTNKAGETLTWKQKCWYLGVGNVETTRKEFNPVIAKDAKWWTAKKVTILFSFCLKYITPVFVIVLIKGTFESASAWFNNPSQPAVYYAIGFVVVAILEILMIPLGALVPKALEFAMPADTSYQAAEELNPLEPRSSIL